MSALAIAPSAPRNVYVGTDRGLFRSTNGGRHWTAGGLAGWRVASIAVDPQRSHVVYTEGERLEGSGAKVHVVRRIFKSTNGGRAWHRLGYEAGVVAVAPTDDRTVYAAGGGPGAKGRVLARSTDGGRTWQPADRGLPHNGIPLLAFDPRRPKTVYAALGRVFESTDGGSTWRPLRGARAPTGVAALALDPRNSETIYTVTHRGVVKSVNGGRTWALVGRELNDPGITDTGFALAVDPRDSATVYAVTCAGVSRSGDAGRTWTEANTGLDAGRCPLERSASIAFDPSTRTAYVINSSGGVFKSTNGGARWRAANDGLSLTSVSTLAVDAQHPQSVYATAGDRGLFRSRDAGRRWSSVTTGLGSANVVAVDPTDLGAVLAAGHGAKIVRSTDGGRTWKPSAKGYTATRVAALAIERDAAYAASVSGALFRSTDGGRSWRRVTRAGIGYVQALAIRAGDADIVYAGSFGTDARGLYRSTDAGRSWRRLTGELNKDVSAVALDPRTPASVYIGTDGVFKSADGGTTWRSASSGLPRIAMEATAPSGDVVRIVVTASVSSLVIDPSNPTTLYAGTVERGVFRSTDAGASWHPLNAGLVVRHVTSLAVDATGRVLYVGTAGGGAAALGIGP